MSQSKKLIEYLDEYVEVEEHPNYHTWPKAKKALYLSSRISTALFTSYSILESEDKIDDQEIVDLLQHLWDRYFVPIDLPINDFYERFVDKSGDNLIPVIVSNLAAWIQELAMQEQEEQKRILKTVTDNTNPNKKE